jgi:hypothetical protein
MLENDELPILNTVKHILWFCGLEKNSFVNVSTGLEPAPRSWRTPKTGRK